MFQHIMPNNLNVIVILKSSYIRYVKYLPQIDFRLPGNLFKLSGNFHNDFAFGFRESIIFLDVS